MIRKKILWAVIIGCALVGAVVGALAIRGTRKDTASQANTSANPTQANNQAQSTVDPSAVEKAPETTATKGVSNGSSSPRYSSRSVYYNYKDRSRRTFWEKHRDKLTVAAGAGTGALVGGLIGGKKGAGVGILAGGAGSALYTYKLRHKRHRY